MNRGNMGKQISNAPKSKSKKVKKMFGGGMASMPPPSMFGGGNKPMPGGGRSPISVPPGLNRPMPMKPMPGGGRSPIPVPPGLNRPMPMPMPGGVRGMSGPKPALMGMAKGGKVRGDGCCMKGKTKGKMC